MLQINLHITITTPLIKFSKQAHLIKWLSFCRSPRRIPTQPNPPWITKSTKMFNKMCSSSKRNIQWLKDTVLSRKKFHFFKWMIWRPIDSKNWLKSQSFEPAFKHFLSDTSQKAILRGILHSIYYFPNIAKFPIRIIVFHAIRDPNDVRDGHC